MIRTLSSAEKRLKERILKPSWMDQSEMEFLSTTTPKTDNWMRVKHKMHWSNTSKTCCPISVFPNQKLSKISGNCRWKSRFLAWWWERAEEVFHGLLTPVATTTNKEKHVLFLTCYMLIFVWTSKRCFSCITATKLARTVTPLTVVIEMYINLYPVLRSFFSEDQWGYEGDLK